MTAQPKKEDTKHEVNDNYNENILFDHNVQIVIKIFNSLYIGLETTIKSNYHNSHHS